MLLYQIAWRITGKRKLRKHNQLGVLLYGAPAKIQDLRGVRLKIADSVVDLGERNAHETSVYLPPPALFCTVITMRATNWEFEQRFWIFGLIFSIAFGLYVVDHTNSAVWLIQKTVPGVNLDSPRATLIARILFLAGDAVVFLAALFRTWATAYLKTEVVHDQMQHADSVVADGPYRYTRNPLYFANIFIALGMGLMASRSGWIAMVIGMWIFGYRLIGREEQMLLETQGDSYRRYLQAVPRFWPSLKPRLPASGARPHWAQAFGGESMFWFFGLAMLAFAITFSLPIAGIVFAAGFAVYFAAVAALRKKVKAQD